jgi:hypothetical protein
MSRQRIEFAVRDALAHADERAAITILAEALVEQIRDGWVGGRVNFGWNAGWVRFQPNFSMPRVSSLIFEWSC